MNLRCCDAGGETELVSRSPCQGNPSRSKHPFLVALRLCHFFLVYIQTIQAAIENLPVVI